ncbi:MAG: rhodanese-like domain-containing protein [Acidobacteriia bacterium]|nr:rhodanese-like domain-containing protein [Terriglobia bacterium]
MGSKKNAIHRILFAAAALLTLAALSIALFPAAGSGAPQTAPSDPWSAAQALAPADLARELSGGKEADRPTILYVGFRTLYQGGHIPGALYFGEARSEQGLAEIKKWAEKQPRSVNLVIYCGCCPFSRCPNIRPAAAALREMGFTRLRVLILPNDLATDWIAKNYPTQKGS